MPSLRRVAGGLLVALGVAGFALLALAFTLPGTMLPSPLNILLLLVYVAGSIGLPLAFILVGRRLLRAPEAPPPAAQPRARPPAIAPVSPEEVADLRAPFTACPDCGYLGIRMPQIGDGLWPGGGELGDRKVCPRCGYQGLAVQFESGEEYAAFLQDLAASTR